MTYLKNNRGNRGGHAIADGEESTAIGGDAGQTVKMSGGRGGDACATLAGSTVIGGRGGRGGVTEGMPGMDVSDEGHRAGVFIEGGMGGEAAQADGRGGRGGLSGGNQIIAGYLGQPLRKHMKRPYWEDDTVEFGRGGDAPDTVNYRARRLIIEMIKADHMNAPKYFLTDVWYERNEVSEETLNAQLTRMGMSWRVSVKDFEYVFADLATHPDDHLAYHEFIRNIVLPNSELE